MWFFATLIQTHPIFSFILVLGLLFLGWHILTWVNNFCDEITNAFKR